MPWIMENGERQFVPREPAPEITPTDPKAPWPDPEGAARTRREREVALLWWKHTLADFCEIHKYCPRIKCRRNQACADPQARCHDEALDVLKERVYPQLRKAFRAAPPAE